MHSDILMAPSKRRKTSGSAGKPNGKNSEQKPLPVTVLSGFLVIELNFQAYIILTNNREVERPPSYATSCNRPTTASESLS